MIKEKNGWWYLVNAGGFYGYPFPTYADAAEALREIAKMREEREAAIDPTASTFIARPCDLPTIGEPEP